MYCSKTEALFDIRVIDTDAQSHAHRSVNTVLATVARERKRKYRLAMLRFPLLCCQWMV